MVSEPSGGKGKQMRAEAEASGGSQVARPTPFLNVPLLSHVRSLLGLRGGPWLCLQTLQAPGQLCGGKTSPHPDPGLIAALWGPGYYRCPLRHSHPIETPFPPPTRSNTHPERVGPGCHHRAVEAPGNLEVASVPKRSHGVKWTPLFTFEAELGRKASAHSDRGSSRVRPSTVFPVPGSRAGVYGWCQGRPSDCGSGHTGRDSRALRLEGMLCFRVPFGQSRSLNQQIPSSPPPAALLRGPVPASNPQSQGLTERKPPWQSGEPNAMRGTRGWHLELVLRDGETLSGYGKGDYSRQKGNGRWKKRPGSWPFTSSPHLSRPCAVIVPW